jgi:hypothetical protein
MASSRVFGLAFVRENGEMVAPAIRKIKHESRIGFTVSRDFERLYIPPMSTADAIPHA